MYALHQCVGADWGDGRVRLDERTLWEAEREVARRDLVNPAEDDLTLLVEKGDERACSRVGVRHCDLVVRVLAVDVAQQVRETRASSLLALHTTPALQVLDEFVLLFDPRLVEERDDLFACELHRTYSIRALALLG